MDPVLEIKAKLPIEELVGQYCQLQKKGRQFICLCPFHNDTKPSLQVSPDKGIAYCFACQTGGDIFSFYQAIEGVDFRQALKDLAERTGVKLEEKGTKQPVTTKDEKERLRECLQAAAQFYQQQLKQSTAAQEYLKQRGVPADQVEQFRLGVAPNSFSATYNALLKAGFAKSEILAAGLGVQKDLGEGKIYDRFRHRLMFPIHDHRGQLVAFGGRTLGEDDAKYINSADGPLYSKAHVLYGFHAAREAVRQQESVVMVEGYFDVLACHRAGISNVVAVSGTALTEQHVKLLKRHADRVVLCLDQDRAGRDAAERAFQLCSAQGMHVLVVSLGQKDPAEAAESDPAALQTAFASGGVPYLEYVIGELRDEGVASVDAKRHALARLSPLLNAIATKTEREHYLHQAALLFGITEETLREDLQAVEKQPSPAPPSERADTGQSQAAADKSFSSVEIALGLFLLYPHCRSLLQELIEPSEGFAAVLYTALNESPEAPALTLDTLGLPAEHQERAAILQLFCEAHGLAEWSDNLATKEIRKNCVTANRQLLKYKQIEIVQQLHTARAQGKTLEAERLNTQYEQILKLARMAR